MEAIDYIMFAIKQVQPGKIPASQTELSIALAICGLILKIVYVPFMFFLWILFSVGAVSAAHWLTILLIVATILLCGAVIRLATIPMWEIYPTCRAWYFTLRAAGRHIFGGQANPEKEDSS